MPTTSGFQTANNLRGVLIGCGFFALNQMHGWRDVEGADIVAICDTNPDRLNAVGNQFGVAARHADARIMLETERPDFVDIATTVPSHRALVELAASLKIPSFVRSLSLSTSPMPKPWSPTAPLPKCRLWCMRISAGNQPS